MNLSVSPRLEEAQTEKEKAETESPGLGLGPPRSPANAMEVTEQSTATHPDVSKSEVADVGFSAATWAGGVPQSAISLFVWHPMRTSLALHTSR